VAAVTRAGPPSHAPVCTVGDSPSPAGPAIRTIWALSDEAARAGQRATSALTTRRRHGRSYPGARVRWAALRGSRILPTPNQLLPTVRREHFEKASRSAGSIGSAVRSERCAAAHKCGALRCLELGTPFPARLARNNTYACLRNAAGKASVSRTEICRGLTRTPSRCGSCSSDTPSQRRTTSWKA
jgi:hypothetical protein